MKFKTVTKYDRWANQNIWKCYDDVGMSLQKFDDGGHTLVQVSSVMKRVVVWWAKYSRAKGGKTNHRLRWFLLVCLMRIIAFKPSMKNILFIWKSKQTADHDNNNFEIWIVILLLYISISSVCLFIYFLFQLYLKTPKMPKIEICKKKSQKIPILTYSTYLLNQKLALAIHSYYYFTCRRTSMPGG